LDIDLLFAQDTAKLRRPSTVKTAAHLVKDLSCQNKVNL